MKKTIFFLPCLLFFSDRGVYLSVSSTETKTYIYVYMYMYIEKQKYIYIFHNYGD